MLLAHASARALVLAAECPNLAEIKDTIARLGVAMLALLLASLGAIALYAGLRYTWSLGRGDAIAEAKSTLVAGGKGVAIGALATPIVGLLLWILGAKACEVV